MSRPLRPLLQSVSPNRPLLASPTSTLVEPLQVYEALKEAGASEEKAAAAAEAIEAVREGERVRRIEERLTRLEGRMTLLQWMLGFNLVIEAAVLSILLV
jgi:hypothetical protein